MDVSISDLSEREFCETCERCGERFPAGTEHEAKSELEAHMANQHGVEMDTLSDELKAKFRAFHEAYEAARLDMTEQDLPGAVIAVKVWEKAQEAVPLTEDELMHYKLHVAMHSVNRGELFGH